MYERLASRKYPLLLLLLLDDSGSMQDPLTGSTDPKAAYVEQYLAHIIKELVSRSTEMNGDTAYFKARYFLSVIPYGASPTAWGTEVMNIQEAYMKYDQDGNTFGLGGNLGGTDSKAAYQMAYDILLSAVADERFRDSYPCMVLHLTDGESQTDANAVADNIKKLATTDGNVLVVNAYIGTQTNLSYQGPEDFIGYTDVAEVGPSPDNIRLYNMSSVMPESLRQVLITENIFPQIRPGSRLFYVRAREMLKSVIQVVGSVASRANR